MMSLLAFAPAGHFASLMGAGRYFTRKEAMALRACHSTRLRMQRN